MKIKEYRPGAGLVNHPAPFSCVRSLAEGEPIPAGAEIVPDETPEHDWQREDSE